MRGPEGFLAIWSDVSDADRTDYLHWLTREHIEERLAVPGFFRARVFRARRDDINRYLILYELAGASVLGSAPYLARLNQPTAWSQRVMRRLTNFRRGGGQVASKIGFGRGGLIRPIIASSGGTVANWRTALPDRVCRVCVMVTDVTQTGIETAEKKLRTGDTTFAGLVVLEGFDAAALRDALPGTADETLYETVFAS